MKSMNLKLVLKYTIILVVVLQLLGCEKSAVTVSDNTQKTNTINNPQTAVICGQAQTQSLIAGQNITSGSVTISKPLSSLVVTTGTFAGWTVAQILSEGNKILGGCASLYTASQINNAIDMINNNFDNGTVVGTYLTCP